LDLNEIPRLIAGVVHADAFLGRPLTVHGPTEEETHWELFQGRALDHTMTRRRQRFRSWHVRAEPDGEPIISVKWDEPAGVVYVTRGVLSYVHEAYDAGGNTIRTRETRRRVRELVAAITEPELSPDELTHAVLRAVVGTSRLPLTSLEAPLTEFALGQFTYIGAERGLLPRTSDELRRRRLEYALRRGEGCTRPVNGDILFDLWGIFRAVSLSPYTGFVANALALLRELEGQAVVTTAERLDFLARLLSLQWRHLNAYDLITFHHRGANYPDALLIGEVFRELLAAAEQHGELMAARRIQRGLRAGWLLHTLYAGLRVPELPTSPGENQRVLPFPRVPDEQIVNPKARPHTLFNQPLDLSRAATRVLDAALAELPDDIAELGTALILDRPLGFAKSPGEPDRTPMFSHVCRSRLLAGRVLGLLRIKAEAGWKRHLGQSVDYALAAWQPEGVPLPHLDRPARPGVVSLQDAFQVADDFVIERTTFISVIDFLAAAELGFDDCHALHAVVPTPTGLAVFNAGYERWLEWAVTTPIRFRERRGVEIPALKTAWQKK